MELDAASKESIGSCMLFVRNRAKSAPHLPPHRSLTARFPPSLPPSLLPLLPRSLLPWLVTLSPFARCAPPLDADLASCAQVLVDARHRVLEPEAPLHHHHAPRQRPPLPRLLSAWQPRPLSSPSPESHRARTTAAAARCSR
eukprot:984934-Rhodomonas_salina.2